MEIQKAGARGHNSAFFRKKCGFRVVARKRITAHQVSPGSPASRSSWLGQRGAHPHRDNQITTSAYVKKRKIERATRFFLSPLQVRRASEPTEAGISLGPARLRPLLHFKRQFRKKNERHQELPVRR